jgi:uncharacterized protein DUF4440
MTRCQAAVLLGLFASVPASKSASQQAKAPARVATTLDSTIVRLERRLWEAVQRKDVAAAFKVIGPSFQGIDPRGIVQATQASMADAFASCETRSYAMDSITVTPVGDNVAVLAYRYTWEQTCGGGQPEPSPAYCMEVWTRRNGQWQVVSRSDTPALSAVRR